MRILIRLAWYQEGNVLVDRLLPAVSSLVHSEDQAPLRRLANIQHAAGFVKSQVTRANETAIPFAHYQEMERVAHILNDQTLLNIALTYEGDMLQRGGDLLPVFYGKNAALYTPTFFRSGFWKPEFFCAFASKVHTTSYP